MKNMSIGSNKMYCEIVMHPVSVKRHACFISSLCGTYPLYNYEDMFINRLNINHLEMTNQIRAVQQLWQRPSETGTVPAQWGRQRWGEKSPKVHRTVGRHRQINITLLSSHFKLTVLCLLSFNKNITYPSHPPVVVVFIFVSWLYERKRAVIASHVTSETYKHLKEAKAIRTHLFTCTIKLDFPFTFPRGGWTSKKKVLLM